MGMFDGLKTDGLEEKEDRLGGGGWVRDTDAYEVIIKMAFAGASTGGARYVDFTFLDSENKEYNETVYFTSSTDKGGKHYYMVKDKDKKETGKKKALPGFEVVNDICLLTTETELENQRTEEKIVKVYDKDAKSKIPKSMPVLVDLLDKPVILLIQKKLENKNEKNASGVYEPTAETEERNNIEKAAHSPTKLTVLEAQKGIDPEFVDAWVEKNKGNTYDARKIKGGEAGQAGRPGGRAANSAPPAQGGTGNTGERRSLFDKKG